MAIVVTDRPIITLTTDIGLKDNYIGIVKGVISGINHRARLIDISHNVPPFNIEAARYIIETSCRYFPAGSIHLAVIDPGVGSKRRVLLIETDRYFFVGPDNGLFSFLIKREIKRIISITNKKYFLSGISSTFHARDILAPTAAFLSAGISPEEFGPQIHEIKKIKSTAFRKTRRGIIGKVIYIDHFGNLASSIKVGRISIDGATISLNGKKIGPVRKTFSNVKEGQPVCYVNSFGYLEIAVNRGSAANYFGIDYSTKSEILIASN